MATTDVVKMNDMAVIDKKIDKPNQDNYFSYVSPLQGRETYYFSPCVCLSVRLSVRPSVTNRVRHKSCPLYNLKTVRDFSMKLGTLVNHDETMCHAQEP